MSSTWYTAAVATFCLVISTKQWHKINAHHFSNWMGANNNEISWNLKIEKIFWKKNMITEFRLYSRWFPISIGKSLQNSKRSKITMHRLDFNSRQIWFSHTLNWSPFSIQLLRESKAIANMRSSWILTISICDSV